MTQKTTAIYGGAFDPPHIGHAFCMNHLLNDPEVENILLVPSGDTRYDKAPKAEAVHRLAMLKIFLKEIFPDEKRLQIETVDIDGKVPGSATIDLLGVLKSKYKDQKFSFVIGADNLQLLPQWKSYETLIREITFLCVPRLGEKVPGNIPAYARMLGGIGEDHFFATNISSSGLRGMVVEEKSVQGFVAVGVREYMLKNSLYTK